MPIYISPEGHARIVKEYNALLHDERPRITAEVAYAASLGDRSENSEYIYGKQRMREIDRRLRYLQQRLENTTVIDAAGETKDVIGFGATVEVEDADGAPATWTFLGEDEVDIAQGIASLASPLGKALVGKRVGEEVTWQTPRGPRELLVVALRYPHAHAPDERA